MICKPAKTVLKRWNKKLAELGLSMDQGLNPNLIYVGGEKELLDLDSADISAHFKCGGGRRTPVKPGLDQEFEEQ